MDSDTRFIVEKLINKSNIVVGFVVIQSITLAYKLADQQFMDKIFDSVYLSYFIFISHLIVVAGALAGVLVLGRKQNASMPLDVKKALSPLYDSYIKCAIILMFGPIPLLLLLMAVLN
ncbi:MAG: hypothetical protein DRJ07_17635 [Bacteroidetes bacterium]|nr:MAG: hypothetical protein DRJ07_17635 [Bacteroidota bacterium]